MFTSSQPVDIAYHKELYRRLETDGHRFKWTQIKQDLKALQQVTIEEDGKRFFIRSRSQGICGNVFKAVGVAILPTIKES